MESQSKYDVEEIIKRQNELDEITRTLWKNPTLDGISSDGRKDISNERVKKSYNYFINSRIKILWTLKEPNRKETGLNCQSGELNERDWYYCNAGYSYSKNRLSRKIIDTVIGIQEKIYTYDALPKVLDRDDSDGGSGIKYYISESDERDHEPMSEIAVINVNKDVGGSVSDRTAIEAQYSRPEVKKLLLDQIDYIKPQIIINASKVFRLSEDITGVKMTDFNQTEAFPYCVANDRLIIHADHPGCRYGTNEYCTKMFNVIKKSGIDE